MLKKIYKSLKQINENLLGLREREGTMGCLLQ